MPDRDSNYWTRRSGLSRRRFVAGGATSAAALAAFAAVGCGDDDDKKTATATSAATGTGGSPSASAAAATPTQRPKDFLSSIPVNPEDKTAEKDFKTGGSMNRMTDRTFGFDTVSTGQTSNVGQVVLAVYNRLVKYGTRAGMKSVIAPDLEGDLAASWETPDETTIVFQLQPNIKFQNVAPLNGRALTADDIKYTFNRGSTHQKGVYKSEYTRVSAVEDVGGGKVRLKLVRPFPPMVDLLTWIPFMIVPQEIAEQQAITTAVGTGSFIINKVTPNVSVEYRKNPDYFKKDGAGKQKPYMDVWTLNFVADVATRQALAESGKMDICYQQSTPITFDNVEDIAKRNSSLVFQANGQVAPFFSVGGHWNKPPWNDVRVRRALNMLMDRESIMKSIHKGLSHVGPFVPWPIIAEKEPTPAELGPNYKFDVKEAKALLSAAGINNLELTLDWYVSGTNEEILTVFQQSAAQAGVKLNLAKAPDITAHSAKQTGRNWQDLIVFAKSASYNDVASTTAFLTPGTGQNWSETNDPELNKLHEKIDTARGADRKSTTKAIWDRHLDQVFEIMMPQKYDLMFWNGRVHNFRNTAFSPNTGHGETGFDSVWIG